MVSFYLKNNLQLVVLFSICFLFIPLTKLTAQPTVDASLYFTASDAAAFDEYGGTVSAGNEMTLVSATNKNNNAGAVYVLTLDRTTGEWSEDYILTPSPTNDGDRYGAATDVNNLWGVVGAPGTNEDEGVAYVYFRAEATLTLTQQLTPVDTSTTGFFGSAIAANDSVIVVGAYGDDDKGTDAGAVYVYKYTNNTWLQIQKILPDNIISEDNFGYSVDISGDYIAIGAYHKDLVTGLTSEPQSGIVYIYKYNATTGQFEFMDNIFASDRTEYDYFGCDIAISQNNGQPVVLVGAFGQDNVGGGTLSSAGAAYFYQYDGTSWNETKIEANAPLAGDNFGWSVGLDSLSAIIGAPMRNNGNGSAFLFQVNPTGATFVTPVLSATGDEFTDTFSGTPAFGNMGVSVDLSMGVAATGAYRNAATDFNAGAAFIYELLAKPVDVDASFAQFETGVQINWTDRSSGEDGFRIYRDDVLIATVGTNVTTYFDTTTNLDTLYVYCVRAFSNQWGESQQLCDFGLQAEINAPSNLFVSYAADTNNYEFETYVALDWINQSSVADSFYVYKNQMVYDTIPITQQFYIDLAVASPNDYEYCIQAFQNIEDITYDTVSITLDTVGVIIDIVDTVQILIDTTSIVLDTIVTPRELVSGPVCGTGRALLREPTNLTATNPFSGATTNLEDHVVLDWVDAGEFNNGFFIYRDGFLIDSVPGIVPGAYQYIDWDAVSGVTHTYCVSTYRVVNLDTIGFISESFNNIVCVEGGILLDEPFNVDATDGDFETQIDITWSDTSAINERFRIYRDSVLIVEIVDTDVNDSTFVFSYTDTYNLQTQQEYQYCIASWHPSLGESAWVCDNGFIQIKNPSSDLCEGTPPNATIPDNGGVTSTVTNSGSGTALGSGGTELYEVCLLIDHDNIEDLELILTAPDGTTTMTLSNGAGGTGDDYGNTITDVPVCFTSDATESITNYTAGETGEWQPQNTNLYTYAWYNVNAAGVRQPAIIGTIESITGIKNTTTESGVYDLVVTDGSGCQTLRRIEVGNNNLTPYTTNTTVSNASCGVANGSIIVTLQEGSLSYTSANPGVYTFAWSDGGTGFNRTNLAAGTYTATISDNNACTEFLSVTVGENTLQPTISSTDDVCDNGTIVVEIPGATSTYNIVLTPNNTGLAFNGVTLPFTISNLESGAYTVNVQDAAVAACGGGGSVVVTANPLSVRDSITQTSALNFNADIEVTGGAAPYTYAWSDGNTNEDRTGLSTSTTYNLTVTDAGGCTVEIIVQVAAFTAVAEKVTDIPACAGFTRGAAKAIVEGDGEPFSYEWYNSGGTLVNTKPIATNLPAGTYAVNVTSNGGTSLVSNTITIEENNLDATSVNIATTNASCINNGAATTTINYAGNFSYTWSNGATTANITNLAAGAYTLTITDTDFNCTYVANVNIASTPSFTYTVNTTNPTACATADGEAAFTACAGCTYAWPDGSTLANRTDLAPGSYNVTVTNGATTCSLVENIVLEDVAAFTANVALSTTDCNEAVVTVTGGTGASTFAWSNGAGTNDTASALITGQVYTVTVTNSTCSIVETITIPDALTAYFDKTSAFCGSAGTAAINVNGGVGPYTYEWSNDVTNTSDNDSFLSAGTYTVTVTDDLGCTLSSNVTITDDVLYELTTLPMTKCGGNDAAAAIAAYGQAGFTYNWSGGTANAEVVTGLGAGNYTVQILKGSCNLTAGPFTVTDLTPPTIDALTPTETCIGESTGKVATTVSGGNPPYTYAWSGANGSFTSTNANIENLAAGTYTLTVTDIALCEVIQTVTVGTAVAPTVTMAATPTLSCGNGGSGTVTATATGGTGAYSYIWSNGTNGTNALSNLTAGIYTVTVTDNTTGCQVTASATVTANNGISGNIVNIINAQCGINGSATAVGVDASNGNYTYQWSDGQTTQTATNLIAGTYFVTITDADVPACTVVRNVSINNTSAPVTNVSISPQGTTAANDCTGQWLIETETISNNSQSNFGRFNGVNPNGAWTLAVNDNGGTANTTGGILDTWYMVFSDGDCRGGLLASDGTFEDRVVLTWVDASAVNDGYTIYRDGVPIKVIYDDAITTFTDSINITSCEKYNYCIEAFSDIYGVSEQACNVGYAEIIAPTNVNAFDGLIGLSGFCKETIPPTQHDITDFSTITSTITNSQISPSNNAPVALEQVCVLIKHTYVGDLEISLTNGTNTILLADNVGGGEDDLGDIDNGIELCFSEADPSYPNINSFPSGNGKTGPYQPLQSFSAFTNFFTDWTISVTDQLAGDQGKFISWSIYFDNNSTCLDEEELITLPISWTDNSIVNNNYEIHRDGVRIGVMSDTTGIATGQTFIFYDQDATPYTLHNYCIYATEDSLGSSKPGCDEGKRNALLSEAHQVSDPNAETPVVTTIPNTNDVDQMGFDVDIDGPRVAIGTLDDFSKSFVFTYEDESGNGVKKWYYDDVAITSDTSDNDFNDIRRIRNVAISDNYLWTGGANTSSEAGVATAHDLLGDSWNRTKIRSNYNVATTTFIPVPGGGINTSVTSQDVSFTFDGYTAGIIAGQSTGISVAVDGNTAVLVRREQSINLGFINYSTPTASDGQLLVEIYKYEGLKWINDATIVLPDATAALKEAFNSIDIDGNFFIVGAPNADNAKGKAFIYERGNDGNYTLQSTIVGTTNNSYLGWSVAISGNIALVGTAGASGSTLGEVRVYEREQGAWNLLTTLQQSGDADNPDDMEFGYDIAYDSEFIAVGAPTHNNSNGTDAGAVFIYQRTGDSFTQARKLVALDGETDERFGNSVAIDNGFVIIGAPKNSDNGIDDSGAFYAYYLFDENAAVATDGLFDNRVTVSWSNQQNNFLDDILIYRDNELIATIDPTEQLYNDYDAVPGKVHEYTVAIRHIGQIAGQDDGESSSDNDGTAIDDDLGMKVLSSDFGFMRSNGKITGTVASEGGVGIPDLNVCAEVVGALYALSFDGTDDYVAVEKEVELNNKNFTLEAWIKRGETAAQDIFVTQGNSPTNGFSIGFKDNNDFEFSYSDENSTTQSITYAAGASTEWEHWAVAYDTTGIVQIYRNANLVKTQSITTFYTADNKQFTLGRAFTGSNYFFGNLRDVRLWTEARSGVEIEENYNTILKGTEDELEVYWAASEGSGFVVGDYARGKGHHGIIRFNGDENTPVTGASACWTYATPTELQYCDRTDESGYYEITNVFFGNEAEVTITPEGPKTYDPDKQVRELNIANNEATGVNFTDTTLLSITGKVVTPFIPPNQEECPVEGLGIWYKKLNGATLNDTAWIYTNEDTGPDGSYEFTLEEPGEYAIRPRYLSETPDTTDNGSNGTTDLVDLHNFNPSSRTFNIFDDVENVNFEDIEINKLYVRVVGACGSDIGNADVQISSVGGGCYNTTTTTTGTNFTAVDLPPLEYNVLVTNVVDGGQVNVGAVSFLSTRFETIDLKENQDTVTFVYDGSYQITISDPTNQVTCPPLEEAFIMDENTSYPIQFEIFQTLANGDLCPADSGTIQLVDNISGVIVDTIQFYNGSYIYTIEAGQPQIAAPYTRSLTAAATVNGAQTAPATIKGLIKGTVPRQSTFVTTIDNLPMFIIRRPPGDGSTASLEMGEQLCSDASFNVGGKFGAKSKIKFGAGAGVLVGIGADFQLEVEGTASDKNIQACLVANQTVSTPDNPILHGENGDIYMGAGLNFIYTISDELRVNSCGEVIIGQTLEFDPNEITTTYLYTQSYINGYIIPTLAELDAIAAASGQAIEQFDALTEKATWEDVIDINAKIKDLLLEQETTINSDEQLSLITDNDVYISQLSEIALYNDDVNGLADIYVDSYNQDDITAAFEGGAIVNFDDFEGNGLGATEGIAIAVTAVGGVVSLVGAVASASSLAGIAGLAIGGAVAGATVIGVGLGGLPFPTDIDGPVEFNLTGDQDEVGEVIPWPEKWNYSFTAGPTLSQSVNVNKAWSTSVSVGLSMEGSVVFGLIQDGESWLGFGGGVDLGAFDGETEPLGLTGGFSIGGGRSNTREVTGTVTYEIADDDVGDFFTFDVVGDPIYATPVFRTRSGLSSCPHEDNTALRDTFELRFQAGEVALKSNQPFDEPVYYNIEIQNFNQFELREYHISMLNSSNPDGALLSITGGDFVTGAHPVFPEAYPTDGSIVQTVLTVERGPVEYNYYDLRILAYAPCEYESFQNGGSVRADTLSVSVEFQSPCSDIELFLPTDNWAINAASNDTLPIVINGYDLSNEFLTGIQIEWRNAPYDTLGAENGLSFNIIDILEPAFLQNFNGGSFYTYNWNTSFLPDGEYEIRAKTLCAVPGGSAINTTPLTRGIIDRESPMLFGLPEPADGVFNANDEVSAHFTEPIYCGSTSALNFFIDVVDLTTGDTLVYANSAEGIQDSTAIDYDIICTNEQQDMLFDIDNIWQYEGHLLQVTINNGFQDILGNSLPEPLTWSFVVTNQNVFWNPESITADIYEGATYQTTVNLQNTANAMQSFQLNTASLPSWLSIDYPNATTLAPYGSQEVEVYVNLFDVMLGDSTYTANLTAYVDENMFVDGNGDGITDNDTTYTEQLPISITVKFPTPEWDFDPNAWAYNMSFVLEADINGTLSTDALDQITAIVNGEVRGIANLEYVSVLDKHLAFLTVGSNDTTALGNETVSFRIWDASAGVLYSAVETFPYEYNGLVGNLGVPQTLHAGNELAQCLDLVSGWNFISFNVDIANTDINTVLQALGNATAGDFIKTDTLFAEYVNEQAGWIGNLTNIDISKSYMLKLANADQLCVDGIPVDSQNNPIALEQGWNWIAYHGQETQTVDNALDGIGNAQTTFDLVTGITEFAQYNGSFWLGSLETMSPGEGFKINIQQPGGGSLAYSLPSWVVVPSNYRYNMNIIGEVEIDGFTALNEDDLISAYISGGCRGVAQLEYVPELDKYIAFMTIHSNFPGSSDYTEEIEFRIYDASADTIYTLPAAMNFVTEVKHGTTAEPYKFAISTCAPVSVVATNEDCAGADGGSASVVTELNCGLWNTPCVNPTTYVAGVDTDGQSNEDVSPFSGYWSDGKYEYLIRSEELRQNGFYGGTLTGISFEVLQKNSTQPYSNFSIRLKCVDVDVLDNGGNFTPATKLVYTGDYSSSLGTNTINFTDTYNWDGQSNLVVQICYDNSSFSNDDIIATTNTSYISTLAYVNDIASGACEQNTSSLSYNKRPSMELVGCGVNYQWSDGQTTPVAVDLTPGTYSVLVSFPNGCEISRNVELTGVAGGALVAEAIAVEASCITGNDGAALLTVVGGTPPYSYEWNTGATTADLTGVTPGDYEVVVTDANNCATSMAVNISDSGIAPITLSLTESDASCNGTADGSATVVVTGSSAPYSYEWSNGSTAAEITDVAEGSYAVTVTDANGCIAEALAVIGSGIGGSVDIAFDQLYPVCDGVDNGMVYAEVTGGSGNYSYSWSNGSTEAFLSGVAAGTYDVTITDLDNGCSYESSYALVNSADISPIEAVITDNDLISFYEYINVTLSGGYGDYNFEWELLSGYAQYSVAANGEISIIFEPGAVWSLAVTDSDFCDTNSTLIESSSFGTPDTGSDPLLVSDVLVNSDSGSNTGSISLTVIGGNAPYTYAWSGGDLQGVVFGMGINSLEGLSSGWYTVTITDLMGNSTLHWVWVPLQSRGRGKLDDGEVLLAISPNPVQSSTVVTFAIPADDYVEIRLFNTQGKLLRTLHQGESLSNEVEQLSMNLGDLAKGIYFCELESRKGYRAVTKVVVSR